VLRPVLQRPRGRLKGLPVPREELELLKVLRVPQHGRKAEFKVKESVRAAFVPELYPAKAVSRLLRAARERV